QVVHGKHHRIERTKRCATGAGRTASLPCLALSLSPAQPPGPTQQDRGSAGVYLSREELNLLFLMACLVRGSGWVRYMSLFNGLYHDSHGERPREVHWPSLVKQ